MTTSYSCPMSTIEYPRRRKQRQMSTSHFNSTQILMSEEMRRALHLVQAYETCSMGDIVRTAVEDFLKDGYEWAWDQAHGVPTPMPPHPSTLMPTDHGRSK